MLQISAFRSNNITKMGFWRYKIVVSKDKKEEKTEREDKEVIKSSFLTLCNRHFGLLEK